VSRGFVSLVERFWTKVDRRNPDECWIWTAATNGAGYGKLNSGGQRGRTLLAHRVSYELHFGAIPDDRMVCHSCDTPSCVNPSHLWLGDAKANVQDMCAKGRIGTYDRHGEGNPAHKLTRADVVTIRTRLRSGERQRVLAVEYGVSKSLVSEIKRERLWRCA